MIQVIIVAVNKHSESCIQVGFQTEPELEQNKSEVNLKHAIFANGGVQSARAAVPTLRPTARYSLASSLSTGMKQTLLVAPAPVSALCRLPEP